MGLVRDVFDSELQDIMLLQEFTTTKVVQSTFRVKKGNLVNMNLEMPRLFMAEVFLL